MPGYYLSQEIIFHILLTSLFHSFTSQNFFITKKTNKQKLSLQITSSTFSEQLHLAASRRVCLKKFPLNTKKSGQEASWFHAPLSTVPISSPVSRHSTNHPNNKRICQKSSTNYIQRGVHEKLTFLRKPYEVKMSYRERGKHWVERMGKWVNLFFE